MVSLLRLAATASLMAVALTVTISNPVRAAVASVLLAFPSSTGEAVVTVGSDSRLYGSATGTLFSLNPDGSDFQILHNFSGSDGTRPTRLIQAGNNLVGATSAGGDLGNGATFAYTIDTATFQVTHPLSDPPSGGVFVPRAALAVAGSRLFGETGLSGGATGGAIYSLDLDGNDFRSVYDFGSTPGSTPAFGLATDGSTLFGVTQSSVFAVGVDGKNYQTLHTFSSSVPESSLLLAGNHLFGFDSSNMAYMLATDGTGFKLVGQLPGDGIVASDLTALGSRIYGTNGSLFSFKPDGSDFRFEPLTGFSGRINTLTSGGETLFASGGRSSTSILAIEVPEPSGALLAACGILSLLTAAAFRSRKTD